MLRAALISLWAATLLTRAAAEPVSFRRQIAPRMAMNCHAWHGANPESAAGGLSTRTWTDLKKGGNMGPAIVPGHPEASALLQFVNGARGEAHRMPLGGPPLSAAEIELMRRWIAEGASEDRSTAASYRLQLPSVSFDPGKPIRLFCKLPGPGYVELELTDSRGRSLYVDGGAVKQSADVATIGVTGEWIVWNVRRAPGWPARVHAQLTVSHAQSEPANAVFAIDGGGSPELPAGEVVARVLSWPGKRLIFEDRVRVGAGVRGLEQCMARFDAGLYLVNLRYEARREASVLVRVAARSR